jgi:hypothetical protein
LLAGVALACCVGCPPPPKPPPIADDVPMHQVIQRVNANATAMDFLLKASAVSATGKIRNPGSDRLESFEANGTLYFRKPRNLLARLNHTLALDHTLEIGSNRDEFWYWEKLERRRYAYGRRDEEVVGDTEEVPIRPDYLVEILGLSELPVDTTGPNGPVFEVRPDEYVLAFFDSDETGQLYYRKLLHIGRRLPHLVQSIVYYEPDGHPLICATLSDYKLVEQSSIQAPRRILIEQLRTGSWVRFEFGKMQRSDNTKVERMYVDRSPLERGEDVGDIRRLTHPLPPPLQTRPASAPSGSRPG